MRIVVIGGHGRTGILIVEELVSAGHSVVATIRSPRHMADLVRLGAETHIIDLDKSPLADFAHAFKDAEAVVFAAGSAENEDSAIDRKGVLRTVREAEKAGVRRYIAISALGASTKVPLAFDSKEMKPYYAAKRAANKHVANSALDWTILEPGELTGGPSTGKIALTEGKDIESRNTPRADVARTVAAVLTEPKSAGHTFQLVGGTTPIATAVRKASAKS